VLSLFGGFSIAAMVLVLQSPDKFKTTFLSLTPDQYLTGLLVVLATTAVFSMIGSIASAFMAAFEVHGLFRHLATFSTGVSFASLAWALPLLAKPADPLAAELIAGIEVFMAIVFFGLLIAAAPRRHQTQ